MTDDCAAGRETNLLKCIASCNNIKLLCKLKCRHFFSELNVAAFLPLFSRLIGALFCDISTLLYFLIRKL